MSAALPDLVLLASDGGDGGLLGPSGDLAARIGAAFDAPVAAFDGDATPAGAWVLAGVGGGASLALAAALAARASGHPRPAAIWLVSPPGDPADGDADGLRGLPPLLIQVAAAGGALPVDAATRLHRRARNAGVDATLEVWDDVPDAAASALARAAAWAVRAVGV